MEVAAPIQLLVLLEAFLGEALKRLPLTLLVRRLDLSAAVDVSPQRLVVLFQVPLADQLAGLYLAQRVNDSADCLALFKIRMLAQVRRW
jgi:hypothetical protein